MKINFNYRSAKAWITLVSAATGSILGVLTALGVTVPADTSSLVTGLATTIVSLLSAFGILTADTDNPNKQEVLYEKENYFISSLGAAIFLRQS